MLRPSNRLHAIVLSAALLIFGAAPLVAQTMLGGGSSSGGSGTGSVTDIMAGSGLSTAAGTCNSGDITTTGTISSCMATLDKSANYSIVNGDGSKIVRLTANSATFTLPQATASGNFAAGWGVCFTNAGAGVLTISPTTSTIAGVPALTLSQYQGYCVTSDGTNYVGWTNQLPAITGDVAISAGAKTSAIGSGVVTSTMILDGTIATADVADNAITLAKLATQAAGTVLNNATGSAAVPTATATPLLGLAGTTKGTLRFAGNTSGVVTVQPAAAAGTWSFTWPVDGGTNNYVLSTNGSGVTSWVAQSGGGGGSGGGILNYSDAGLTLTAGTRYVPLGGGGTPSTTEADVSVKAPSAATVANLQVSVSNAPGAGNTYAITLRLGGANQTLTCTISDTATVCQDITHSVTLSQNDIVDWKIVSTGTIITTPTLSIAASLGTSGVGVTSVTCGGVAITSSGTCSGAPSAPQGRLTLVTGTPVMLSDQTAKTTVYYDCRSGASVPIYNGSADTGLAIGSCEISLILDTSNHLSTKLYDVFAYSASGTLALCTGPAWTNSTTRAQAIHNTRGYWTNTASITNCFNNSVDAGAIAADQGTYLGTFYATANGQTGVAGIAAPVTGAGGGAPILGLYNAYNRVAIGASERDTSSEWSGVSAAWRSSDNSASNRISYIDGLAQSFVQGRFNQHIHGNSTNNTRPQIGMNLNSTSATPSVFSTTSAANTSSADVTVSVVQPFPPALGFNFIQAMEADSNATTHSVYSTTVNGGPGAGPYMLSIQLEM